jgi:hypothetical protein
MSSRSSAVLKNAGLKRSRGVAAKRRKRHKKGRTGIAAKERREHKETPTIGGARLPERFQVLGSRF